MTRVKRGPVKNKRRQRILQVMQGARGAHSRLFRTAQTQAMRKLASATRGRRLRKRDFRALWISRLNAAARQYGLSYSQLVNYLRISDILLNRKMLAQMAVCDPNTFDTLVVAITSQPQFAPLALTGQKS